MLFFVGVIIIIINDILVPHVSTCIGHLQIVVNRNEVMVVHSIYMTAVGDGCVYRIELRVQRLCSCINVGCVLVLVFVWNSV
jgi:hypothetical protein